MLLQYRISERENIQMKICIEPQIRHKVAKGYQTSQKCNQSVNNIIIIFFRHGTNKRGSHEDDVAAQTGCVYLPGVLWCLQHLDVVQLNARHIQTLCSKEQAMTLFISNAVQCNGAATMTTFLIQGYGTVITSAVGHNCSVKRNALITINLQS